MHFLKEQMEYQSPSTQRQTHCAQLMVVYCVKSANTTFKYRISIIVTNISVYRFRLTVKVKLYSSHYSNTQLRSIKITIIYIYMLKSLTLF